MVTRTIKVILLKAVLQREHYQTRAATLRKQLTLSFLSLLVWWCCLINTANAEGPQDFKHASWAFSGMVTNEKGDNFNYFFQMQRDANEYHALAALFDAQNKEVLLLEDSQALTATLKPNHWQAGFAFLRFNPINNSWIFGLKTKDKKGFNFKVDMLNPIERPSVTQTLRPGIEFIVNETGQLNGHIQAQDANGEQFVTAKSAWFRQIWMSEEQKKNHPFFGVLCRFDDGSGFYSVNMPEKDVLVGAVTGSTDAEGLSTVMSQFIEVKEEADGFWHIRVASPRRHLILTEILKQNSMVAGFVKEGERSGFCVLNQDVVGHIESQFASAANPDLVA